MKYVTAAGFPPSP